MTKRRRRGLIVAAVVVGLIALLIGRPTFYVVRAIWRDRDEIAALPPGEVGDASRLNPAAVA